MRLIYRDPKTGLLKLRLETPSDLWRIARLVRPEDLVGASTTRRDPEAPEEAPAAQRERRRVWLVLKAEQVEFHGFSRHVRITGPIVEGPFDIGRHHTLDLGEGDELSVVKDVITVGDRALIDEGVEGRGEPTVLIAAVDWGESSIVRLRGRAIVPVADLNRTLSGKRFQGVQGEKDRATYLDEIVRILASEGPKADLLILAGPGFLKEAVSKALAERRPDLREKVRVFSVAESGKSGINELLRSGRASEALRGSVAAEEAALVERLISALGGGRRAAVGLAEVQEAVEAGAAETLLVSESLLTVTEALSAIDAARTGRARVFVVRDEDEAGKRLAGLGRIGAILRYDWAPTATARSGR